MSEFFAGKKPLSAAEFDDFVKKLSASYESKLKEQKERIFSLVDENKKVNAELEEYRKKDRQISQALMMAVQKAKETEQLAKKRYDMEMERLRVFHKKWINYYAEVRAKLPPHKDIIDAEALLSEMDRILGFNSAVFKRSQADAAEQYLSESRRLNAQGVHTDAVLDQYRQYMRDNSKQNGSEDSGNDAQAIYTEKINQPKPHYDEDAFLPGDDDTAASVGITHSNPRNKMSDSPDRAASGDQEHAYNGSTEARGKPHSNAECVDTDTADMDIVGGNDTQFIDADFYTYIRTETAVPAGSSAGYSGIDKYCSDAREKDHTKYAAASSYEPGEKHCITEDTMPSGLDLNEVLAPKDLPDIEELIKEMQLLKK